MYMYMLALSSGKAPPPFFLFRDGGGPKRFLGYTNHSQMGRQFPNIYTDINIIIIFMFPFVFEIVLIRGDFTAYTATFLLSTKGLLRYIYSN